MQSKRWGTVLAAVVGVATAYTLLAVDSPGESGPFKIRLTAWITSPDADTRSQGRRAVLADRERVIKELMDVIAKPAAKTAGEWADPGTAQNIAIDCLGTYRAAEAIPALLPFMDSPDGMHPPKTRIFHLCPAAEALIQIGKPSVGPLVSLLADTPDPDRLSAKQARLTLYRIEGADAGLAVLKTAIAQETDARRRQALEGQMERYERMVGRE